ncbi:hypothetical protein OED01_02865 [Microbacterium sp. M28]|uniref:hypothetical protein n=1 Tax=Microbacterium sp. M28 TaxID=2962064 RepID=UPI0021F46D4F|nr:hypothetical protein [Microbacterium sp. M28]UYO97677.1 hypothetical protein OED01_02865 [Microbacterium sp. M28]
MALDRSTRGASDILRLSRGERLSTIERVVIGAIIAIMVLDLFSLIFTPGVDILRSVTSIVTTALLLIFLWSPLAATCALAVAFVLSFLVGTEAQVLTTASVAAALVMRLGRTSLILSYTGGFLVAAAVLAYGPTNVPVNVGIYLVFATVAAWRRVRAADGVRTRATTRTAARGQRRAGAAGRPGGTPLDRRRAA